MYLFYVISTFLVISGYLLGHGSSRAEEVKAEDMKAQATFMWVYHRAAVDFCQASGTYCNTKRTLTTNQVDDYLPALTVSSGRLTSGRFLAGTDGLGGVITLHQDLQAPQSADMFNEQRYLVSNALKEVVPDYVHAGAYERTPGRVRNAQGDYRSVAYNAIGSLRDTAPLIITDY